MEYHLVLDLLEEMETARVRVKNSARVLEGPNVVSYVKDRWS